MSIQEVVDVLQELARAARVFGQKELETQLVKCGRALSPRADRDKEQRLQELVNDVVEVYSFMPSRSSERRNLERAVERALRNANDK